MPRIAFWLGREAFESMTLEDRKSIAQGVRAIVAESFREEGYHFAAGDISARWLVFDDSSNEMDLEIDIVFSLEAGAIFDVTKLAPPVLAYLQHPKNGHFKEVGVWVQPLRGAEYTSRMLQM